MTAPSATDARSVLARLDRIPVWSLPRSYLVIIGVGYFFTFFERSAWSRISPTAGGSCS